MRSHCEVCETCQAWRDGGEDPPEVLGCGHSADEAIAHTRPCVFVGCTRNNYLDENRDTGAVKFNRPHVEPGDVARDSCSEDVEDEGGATLERVGAAIGVTRERVRQNETIGLRKLKNADGIGLPDDRETYAGSPGPRPGCP
jgi:hypothetical protein